MMRFNLWLVEKFTNTKLFDICYQRKKYIDKCNELLSDIIFVFYIINIHDNKNIEKHKLRLGSLLVELLYMKCYNKLYVTKQIFLSNVNLRFQLSLDKIDELCYLLSKSNISDLKKYIDNL